MGLTNKGLSPDSVLEWRAIDLPSLLEMFVDNLLKSFQRLLTDDEVPWFLPEV